MQSDVHNDKANGRAGLPWSGLSPRWGHPWHPMCSYLGAFPAALAHSFIAMLTEPKDIVLDPFSGRGTTLLEARATSRVPLASDLNPIAIALTRAKNTCVTYEAVAARINEIGERYDPLLYLPEAQVESDEIRLIFHDRTLAQLCYLRRQLISSFDDVDVFLVGVVLGIMHGSERQDGSSGYASISMPNTFSMAPDYVRRYVEINRLQRVERDVFAMLRRKVSRLFDRADQLTTVGVVAQLDAKELSTASDFVPYLGRVKLVLTSPPYLDVVNYARQNWIRCWFLRVGASDINSELDDNLTLQSWLEFMAKVLEQLQVMVARDGVLVFVIGDVARSSRSVMPIAREFLRRIQHEGRFSYVGCLSDHLEIGAKTTRIWGDTKGQATTVDRIIILSNTRPEFKAERLHHVFPDLPNLDWHSELNADRLELMARDFAGARGGR
jgi:hypothetical protein